MSRIHPCCYQIDLRYDYCVRALIILTTLRTHNIAKQLVPILTACWGSELAFKMIAFIVCYLTALAVSLIFLQYHINLLRYPLYYSIPLILAVYMPLSVTILLPIDYVTHNSGSILGFSISDQSTLLMWKATYWSTFILTWLFLPVLQEFYSVGSHSTLTRLHVSLKKNLKFQAIILSCSIASAIYLVLEVGLTFGNLKSMIIALSHIYALVLSLWLMAHGLITIPRNRWLEGNLIQNLNHYYLKLPSLVDSIEDTRISFKDDVLQVMILKENFTSASDSEDFAFRDWILNLYSKIPGEVREVVSRQYVYSNTRTITREQITESFMSTLTHSFQSHLFKLSAHTSEYDILLSQILRLQKLIEAKATSNQVQRNQIMNSLGGILPANMDFYFQCYFKPTGARVVSILLFGVTFIIIESEFFHSTRLSVIDIIVYKTGIHKHNLTQAICTSLFFMYMLFCSLNSLTKLKAFNKYHLVPHNSDPVSACFYGSYIARMTVPLSYNLITLFTSRLSIFEDWYGKSIHLTGLFNLMNDWIPRLLLIPIVLAAFNVYDKIKSKLGLNSDFYSWADFNDADEDEFLSGPASSQNRTKDLIIVEAKRLVAMEINRRKNDTSDMGQLNVGGNPHFANDSSDISMNFDDFLNDTSRERIDQNDNDSDYLDNNRSPFWNRLGDTFAGVRNAFETRFQRQPFRDEPLDAYSYDEDADENLVV